jgi:hypothetical protein
MTIPSFEEREPPLALLFFASDLQLAAKLDDAVGG